MQIHNGSGSQRIVPNHCEHLSAFSLLEYLCIIGLVCTLWTTFFFTLLLICIYLGTRHCFPTYLFSVQIVGHSLLHNQGPLEVSTEYSKLIMHGVEPLKTLKRPNVFNKCKSRVFHPYIEKSLTKFCQLFTLVSR